MSYDINFLIKLNMLYISFRYTSIHPPHHLNLLHTGRPPLIPPQLALLPSLLDVYKAMNLNSGQTNLVKCLSVNKQ